MKKILVVIDAQNDFITGSLRNEEAIAAVPALVKKILSFDGCAIFATKDTHSADYLSTPEGAKLPVVHCVKGTEGWNLDPQVQAALDSASARGIPVNYIEKPTFGSYALIDAIRALAGCPSPSAVPSPSAAPGVSPNQALDLEFVGFCTDICVVSNVLLAKAAFYDTARISVDPACCAGVTPDSHSSALSTMRMCQVEIS